jgi:hypothetical protein
MQSVLFGARFRPRFNPGRGLSAFGENARKPADAPPLGFRV